MVFLKALERLTYCLLVTRTGINERIEIYAALTKEIEPPTFDGNRVSLTTLDLTELQKSEFLSALEGNIYQTLPRSRMDLILRLEALSSDGSKKLQFNQVSIEHVLPQTTPDDSEWQKWFPDENSRESWTHRLANLVPLHVRKNPAASNLPFEDKKNVYFVGKGTSTPFILTNEVRQQDKWTPEVLEKRQKRLVGKFSEHWELGPA